MKPCGEGNVVEENAGERGGYDMYENSIAGGRWFTLNDTGALRDGEDEMLILEGEHVW